MEILVYLAELIQDRKQVGIAGLGTIYKSKVPGRYDIEAHAFLPPSHTLQFSTELLETEALAEYISFKRNISIDAANYYIEQFSNSAVQELSETNQTQLGTLGKLHSVDGAIVFQPTQDGVNEVAYYGLPKVSEEDLTGLEKVTPATIEHVEDEFIEGISVESEESPESEGVQSSEESLPAEVNLKQEEPLRPEEYTEPEKPLELEEDINQVNPVNLEEYQEPQEEIEAETIAEVVEENRREEENPGMESTEAEKAVIASSEAERIRQENHSLAALLPTEINYKSASIPEDIEEKPKNGYVKIILVTLLVLLIAALAFFLYPKMISASKKELQSAAVLDSLNQQNQSDSMGSQDTLTATVPLTDSLQADTLTTPTTAPAQPAVVEPAGTTYEIVIGSLANMKEAKKFIAQMRRKGIIGKVVDSLTSAKIKVSIASFTDHEAAKKERRKIVKQLNDPSIYIYTNKPKK